MQSQSDDMLTPLRVTYRTWLFDITFNSGIISIFAFLCLLLNSSLKVLYFKILYFSKGVFRTLTNIDGDFFFAIIIFLLHYECLTELKLPSVPKLC